jgi:hypothetical protein
MNLFKRSRTFVTLLVMASLFIIEGLASLSRIEKLQLQSDLFWAEKVYGKSQYDVLLMGDSRTYMGVSPKTLRSRIPHISVYNFGFCSGRINKQLLGEAEKRLQKNGKRFLIFSCTSCDLIDTKNVHFFSIQKPIVFSHIFPLHFIKTDNSIKRENCLQRMNSGSVALGFLSQKRKKDEVSYRNTLGSYNHSLAKRPFLPSDFEHFVQNLRWCRRKNIKVVAYRMVSCHEMDELEDKLSGIDWDKIKQAVLDEGFVWLERPPSPLLEQIEEHCWDASHLNEEGAELFSNWLGQELAKLDWFKENQ